MLNNLFKKIIQEKIHDNDRILIYFF
ncbi:hypothetical protein [Blattabacterium punctulatus]